MKEFKITKKYENLDIYSVILKEFPHLNISSLNKAFRLKDIKINDKRVSKDYIVKQSDICKIYLSDNILYNIPKDINYVYEDDNILVCYKPKGIVSNFESGIRNNNIIYFDELVKKEKGENLKILNRLDTNTEGLVLFSKNDISYNELFKAFEQNTINKEYIALVNGKLNKNHDLLSHYIKTDKKDGYSKVYEKNIEGSKTCVTEYSVLKYIKALNLSILSIKLYTGRTHQIRAHMKYIGHEIVGDSKYGLNEINEKFKVSSQMLYAVKYSFDFNEFSPLSYLNNVTIDITNLVQEKINKFINSANKL